MRNISNLDPEKINLINIYLKEQNRLVFTEGYLSGINTEFGKAIQDNNEFLFRGKFTATPFYRHMINNKAVQYALVINSCTSSYTTTEVVLLDEEFNPIKIVHSPII